MLLPGKFIQRTRPHPRRQRRSALEILPADILEQIHRRIIGNRRGGAIQLQSGILFAG